MKYYTRLTKTEDLYLGLHSGPKKTGKISKIIEDLSRISVFFWIRSQSIDFNTGSMLVANNDNKILKFNFSGQDVANIHKNYEIFTLL